MTRREYPGIDGTLIELQYWLADHDLEIERLGRDRASGGWTCSLVFADHSPAGESHDCQSLTSALDAAVVDYERGFPECQPVRLISRSEYECDEVTALDETAAGIVQLSVLR